MSGDCWQRGQVPRLWAEGLAWLASSYLSLVSSPPAPGFIRDARLYEKAPVPVRLNLNWNMKAAILTAPQNVAQRPLTISDVAQPEPGPGHILLKVRACGVCRTDLHIVEGELGPARAGLIPGHQ